MADGSPVHRVTHDRVYTPSSVVISRTFTPCFFTRGCVHRVSRDVPSPSPLPPRPPTTTAATTVSSCRALVLKKIVAADYRLRGTQNAAILSRSKIESKTYGRAFQKKKKPYDTEKNFVTLYNTRRIPTTRLIKRGEGLGNSSVRMIIACAICAVSRIKRVRSLPC